jgi:hypothetical protein
MPETEAKTVPAAQKPYRPLRLVLISCTLVAILMIGMLLALISFHRRHLERELEQALAETDRLDPGWRLEELETARKPVPPERNSALQVLKVVEALPKNWLNKPLFEQLEDLLPQARLNAGQTKDLRAELKGVLPALTLAHSLAMMPEGRFSFGLTDDFIGTLLPHLEDVRTTAGLLRYNALLCSEDEDLKGAVLAFRAGLNAARSIGDEPLLMSQLVRSNLQGVAIRGLERTLAQGQSSSKALQEIQKLLADETDQLVWLNGLRGDRAGMHHLLTNARAGKVDSRRLDERFDKKFPGFQFLGPSEHSVLCSNHVAMLRFYNEAVAIARAAPEQQARRFQELLDSVSTPDAPELAMLWVPAIGTARRLQDRQAVLHCTIVALAVEYHRQQHGRWPEKLSDLEPAALGRRLPRDPYTGGSLGYRKSADGVVVYSVGKDGNYQGDALDRDHAEPIQERPEFRLWNVDRRRQPPRPPRKPAELPGGEGDPPRP